MVESECCFFTSTSLFILTRIPSVAAIVLILVSASINFACSEGHSEIILASIWVKGYNVFHVAIPPKPGKM